MAEIVDSSFDLQLKSKKQEEVQNQLKAFLEYNGKDSKEGSKKGCYITDFAICKKGTYDFVPITEDNVKEVATNFCTGDYHISFSGPWGVCDLDEGTPIFENVAHSAPNADFSFDVVVNDTYRDQHMWGELSNGILTIEMHYESVDDRDDCWKEFIKSTLPLEKFVDLFKISGEDDDIEYAYDDLIDGDYFDSFEDDISDFDYDNLCELLENNNLESKLEEDEFEDVIENKLREIGMKSYHEYIHEDYEGTNLAEEYDAVAGKLI